MGWRIIQYNFFGKVIQRASEHVQLILYSFPSGFRLVDQKGLDLIAEITEELIRMDLQMAILGSGDRYYEDMFKKLKERDPLKAGMYIGYKPTLSQWIRRPSAGTWRGPGRPEKYLSHR